MSRAEWVLILALAAIQFTHMVDFVIIMPLGDRLMTELAITPKQFSYLVSAYSVMAAVTGILASSVIDCFDRRTVLLVLYAGFTVSTLLCGLAPNYETLLAARSLTGVFGGLSAAGIMAVIGDVFTDSRRGKATGAVMSAFAVASTLGLPVGLALAAEFGRGAPFLALAGLGVVVWVVAFASLPTLTGHRGRVRLSALAEFKDVVRPASHRWAFAFSACVVLGTFTVVPFLGPYMIANGGRTEHDLSWVYGSAGLCTLIVMNVMGRVADQYDRKMLFRVAASFAVVMTLVVTNIPPASLLVGCVMAACFMSVASARMVPAQAMLIGMAEPRLRGGFMSVNTAVQHIAMSIAPVVAGALIVKGADGKLAGYPAVGLIAAGAGVVAIILAGRLSRPTPTAAQAVNPLPAERSAEAAAEPLAV